MNQGNNLNNNVQNANTTPVTPTPMPSTGTVVTPTPMPASGNVVAPTPVASNVVTPNITAPQTPIAPVQTTPVAQAQSTGTAQVANTAPVVNTAPVQTQPIPVNTQNIVAPTENVINTSKKKSGNIFLIIAIIIIVLFVYYIDEVLLYFNQNFVPATETQVEESGGARLVNGLLQINSNDSAYIKVKSIKFHTFKKDAKNKFIISYLADRNYSNPSTLNLMIELYNKDKEKIYEEKFNPVGAIEALKLRQYQITVTSEIYENALYVLVKEQTNEGN